MNVCGFSSSCEYVGLHVVVTFYAQRVHLFTRFFNEGFTKTFSVVSYLRKKNSRSDLKKQASFQIKRK